MNNTAEVIKIFKNEGSGVVKVASLDNGYTRLANEILEAAISHDMTKRQIKIFFAVVRKTYGFNKKRDRISGSQFATLTQMPRARCSATLNELIEMNVLTRTGGVQGEIEINKKVKEWGATKQPKSNQNRTKVSPKKNSTKTVTVNSTETVTTPSAKTVHTKDNSKDNTKDKELAKANSSPQLKNDPVVAWLPTNKKDERFEVTQSMLDEWSETFQNVDVMQHLRQMYTWSNANSTRRKTKRGMPRFIVNWLAGEQDKSSRTIRYGAGNPQSSFVGDQLSAMQQSLAHVQRPHDDEEL